METHEIDFTDEERSIIDEVGIENEDYAICAIFNHRNPEEIDYDEESSVITVDPKYGEEVKQTVGMLTDIAESSDPLERIGVGVSMLEVAVHVQRQCVS